MANGSIGFLEHLYRGSYRRDLSIPRLASSDFAKADALAAGVGEALKGFDTRKIELAGRIPGDLMERLSSLGIFGILVPREFGGLGFTISEYLRFTERMAGLDVALLLVPLAHLSIGVMGLLLFGNEEQKRRYLPRAASGETIFAFALTEPQFGSDAQNIRTTARKERDGYLITGTKTYITNANYAGAFTLFAQLDGERPGSLGAFVVEREWEGVTVGKDMPKMGLHISSTAAVMLKEVKVPAANLLGDEGEGFKIAMTILNYGRLALGASSSGLMSASVEDMVSRATSRRQFGVPILDFELIQEKIARSKAHAFAAGAMTYFTASLLDADPVSNVAIESSHAKLYGTTRCWDTLYEAMQTAGGSGYLSTQPYEKRMRDFRVTTIFEGTSEIHSIYPPLSLFRFYGRELSEKGKIGKWLLLRRIAGTRALAALKEFHPVLREAAQAAARSEGLFRRLLRHGIIRFRAKVTAEELYLRRMTHLSLSLFWLVASIGYLHARYPGENYPEEELLLLEYLIAEAEEVQEMEGKVGKSRLERAQARIAASLVEARGEATAAPAAASRP